MSRIENIKVYEGQDLANIFFRPMLTGKSAEDLGIKVLYNMPVPTILHFWRRNADVLKKYSGGNWSGGGRSDKFQKTIKMNKVKAEMSYAADDYFSTVYELITGRADVNLDDLSGTELEAAETALFRESIAEGIRATMWYGDTKRTGGALATFDGVIKNLMNDVLYDGNIRRFGYNIGATADWGEAVLHNLWTNASDELKSLRSEGQLAYFVSTDVYNAYEEQLDNVAIEAAYLAKQNGREGLFYRGIPVIDVQLNCYNDSIGDLPHSFAILTDRRNIALAVNTNDFPGTEVRMWYNPDVMENRQRAIFMAGCDYLLPELVSMAVGSPLSIPEVLCDGETISVSAHCKTNESWVGHLMLIVIDDSGERIVDEEYTPLEDGAVYAEFDGDSIVESRCAIIAKNGCEFMLM